MADLPIDEPNDMDKQRALKLATDIVMGSQAHRDTHAMARYLLWLKAERARLIQEAEEEFVEGLGDG